MSRWRSAEQLRDQGLHVLLLMDSVTRFAMAQREVGRLSAGEPPASKGYTPTVIAELPRLLERAGPGFASGQGSITGLFTVLVEGDDHNEPVADAVRGILDGHIVLERQHRGARGVSPRSTFSRSVSRRHAGAAMRRTNRALVLRARAPLAVYEDMAELIRLGAYKAGTNPEVDNAVKLYPALEAFLSQRKDERATFTESYAALGKILGGGHRERVVGHETRRYVDPGSALPRRRDETPSVHAGRHDGRRRAQACRPRRQRRARTPSRRRFRHRPARLPVLPALHREPARESARHAEGHRARAHAGADRP